MQQFTQNFTEGRQPPTEVAAEKKVFPSPKRLITLTAIAGGIFLVLVCVFLFGSKWSPINSFVNKTIPDMNAALRNGVETVTNGALQLFQDVFTNLGDNQIKEVTTTKQSQTANQLTFQVNRDGSKTYPVQSVNLWGYSFYTSKIDSSGNIDIGSSQKQSIAELFQRLSFPPKLTKNLIIINIDPTLVTQNDKIEIPWAGSNVVASLQPQAGTYQNIYGGAVIALNNRTGYSSSVLSHELGHVIGVQLTDTEWTQYYKLRGIPADTPRSVSDWSVSPQEDFAEVYRYAYLGEPISTKYGLLKGSMTNDLMGKCYSLAFELQQDWLAKYGVKDTSGFMYASGEMEKAENAIQANPQLQACREANNTSPFGGPLYRRQVSEEAKQLIISIVKRLSQ